MIKKEARLSSDKIFLVTLLLIYVVTIFVLYRFYISTMFPEYPDFSFSPIRIYEAWMMILLTVFTIPHKWVRPSAFYYTMIVVGVFLPMCVIYASSDQGRNYFYIVAITIFVIRVSIKMPNLRFPFLNVGGKNILLFLFVFLLSIYIYLIMKNNGHFNLSLNKVYGNRIYFREVINGIWGYLLPWAGKIVIPIFVGYSLFRKSYLSAMVLSVAGLLLFPLTSHKVFLLFSVAPFILYFVFLSKKPVLLTMVLIILGLLIAVFMQLVFQNIWGIALYVQRGIFKPALLNFVYADFFKDHDLIMLSNSKLFFFIKYPYDVNPAFLIGKYLKGSIETRSNTGFLGTGYAHFGLLGPIIFGFFVSFLLKWLDTLSRKMPVWLACAVSLGPFSSLIIMADFLPSLFTQGVFLSLFLLWLIGNFLGDCSCPQKTKNLLLSDSFRCEEA